MKIIPILLIALLVLGSYSTFNYAYAVDNNCMIIPIHIIQMPIPLGCIEQRLDALENATPSGSDTTICGNQGGKTLIHISGTNCDAKSLIGSADISITNSSNTITIDYNGTLATESTNCNNVGTGTIIHVTSSNCNAKSLKAGTGISIANTTNDITYSNTYTCTSAGGTTLIKTSTTGSNCDLKGLTAGTSVTVTSGTNDNTIGLTTASCSAGFFLVAISPLTCGAPVTWDKLCSTNLGSSGTSISCGAFSARKFLHIYADLRTLTSTMVIGIQFNADTGTNYAWRQSLNTGAETTGVSVAQCQPMGANTLASGAVSSIELVFNNNQATDRKVGTGLYADDTATTVATAPEHGYFACKWGNTASQITTVNFMRQSGTGVYNTNSIVEVWGHD